MRREIKIIHRTGREQWLSHLSSEERREIGSEDLASLFIPRTEIDNSEIEEGHDVAELRLGGEVVFSGPIEDVVRHDQRKELIVESPERYAERAQPTDAVDEWNNAPDGEIIRDAIESVPELEVGNIGTTDPAVSFLFSHASPAYKARKVEDSVPGVLRYNPDQTVDFGRLGRNKSHITLSPRRDNVGSDFEVERKASYDRVTHLRLLGAGEGEHQKSAEAVADSYQSGDPQIWKTYHDKGLTDEETIRKKAENYVGELKTKLLEVELVVKGTRVDIGDRFRVYIPSEDVDEILEVVEHNRVVDNEGIRHEVTLSNHRDTREDPEEKNRADLSHYNQAVEGTSVPINTSGGRQPVNPDNNYELQLYYPSEVEYEHRLNVRLIGLPYRSYSAGSQDNSDFTTTVIDSEGVSSYSGIELTKDAWVNLKTATIPDDAETSTLYATTNFFVHDMANSGDYDYIEFDLRYRKNNGEVYLPGEDGWHYFLEEGSESYSLFVDPSDVSGDKITIQARLTDGPDYDTELGYSHMFIGAGKHIHEPEPGIIEDFGGESRSEVHYPSDCQVIVNGDPVGPVLEGSEYGRWSDSVDIRGYLDEGQINTIEVSSETLGHIQGYVEGDIYRVIRSRG